MIHEQLQLRLSIALHELHPNYNKNTMEHKAFMKWKDYEKLACETLLDVVNTHQIQYAKNEEKGTYR
eukprot:Pgem_evm2s606